MSAIRFELVFESTELFELVWFGHIGLRLTQLETWFANSIYTVQHLDGKVFVSFYCMFLVCLAFFGDIYLLGSIIFKLIQTWLITRSEPEQD